MLGGAFDPPHMGHLAIATGVRDALPLDRVLFIPYAEGPHRPEGPRASGAHRFAMLEAALSGLGGFEADDRELRRGGPSYTVDTLEDLAATYPDADLYLILGSDQAATLPDWRGPERITALAHIAVAIRPDHPLKEVAGIPPDRIVRVDLPRVLVSSTQIRQRTAAGQDIQFLVPGAVARYIEEHGLYRSDR